MKGIISCAEARRIDLVDYLLALGYTQEKVKGNEYWYRSPLRVENNASFKVDKSRNIWYDHGLGRGGTLIDFGLLFHRCSLAALLKILNGAGNQSFPSHPPILLVQKQLTHGEKKLKVMRTEPVENRLLEGYILGRGISLKVARKYLEQIIYTNSGKEFLALGFKNNAGGYELRNERFKGSSSPKDSTLIQQGKNCDTLAVFEGMFSFLSYLELKENRTQLQKKNLATDAIFDEKESQNRIF
jgi:hypothetical protein